MCRTYRNTLAGALIGLVALVGCGDADGSNTSERAICEEMTPPEEIESCVASPQGEGTGSWYGVRELEQLCDSNCDTITGVSISQAIKSLKPLKNIREVRGTFDISTAIGLESLAGVENIESIGVYPYPNAAMVNIAGPDLVSTEGFDSLRTIQARETVIRNNYELQKIEGFPKLERIEEGGLVILRNPELESISAFQNLEYVGGPLIIEDNPNLPRCEAQALVDGIDTITGEVTIQNNGTGSCD